MVYTLIWKANQMDKIKIINRYLVDFDTHLNDGVNLVNNKSIWVKLLPMLTRYEGSVKRFKSMLGDVLIVTYFIKGKVNSFRLYIANGILRVSDNINNTDFDNCITILHKLITKYNSFSNSNYKLFTKKLRLRLK